MIVVSLMQMRVREPRELFGAAKLKTLEEKQHHYSLISHPALDKYELKPLKIQMELLCHYPTYLL